MAIVSNTLIGKTRGSVGNATFSTWKGRNVLKEKSTSPANPKTPAQMLQRSKFSRVVAYVSLLVQFLVDFWGQVSLNVTQYNWLSSKLLRVVSGNGLTLFPVLPIPLSFVPNSNIESISVDLAFYAPNVISVTTDFVHSLPDSPQYYDIQWFFYDSYSGRKESSNGTLAAGGDANDLTVFDSTTTTMDVFCSIYNNLTQKYVYIAQLQAVSVSAL